MSRIGAEIGSEWRRHADPAWLERWTPIPFDLRDGWTEVVTMGEGETVLLLPSLPGYKETWVACAHRLARRFRIVTWDLRVRFQAAMGWGAMLADLERIADAFAPMPSAVVGHSLGGALALRWALLRPARVRALVLSSTFARVTTSPGQIAARYLEQPLVLAGQRWLPEPLAARLARDLAARGRWVYDPACDERVLGLVRAAIRATPIPLGVRMVKLAFAHDVRARLGEIAAPALIVTGERERTFVQEAAAELARGLPRALRAVSPGTGHLHPLSGSEWLADAISKWLPRAGTPRAGTPRGSRSGVP